LGIPFIGRKPKSLPKPTRRVLGRRRGRGRLFKINAKLLQIGAIGSCLLEKYRCKSSDSRRESVALQDREPECLPAAFHHLGELGEGANTALGAMHLDLDESMIFELAQECPNVVRDDSGLLTQELVTGDAALGASIVVADVSKEPSEPSLGIPSAVWEGEGRQGVSSFSRYLVLHVWFSVPADTGGSEP
jgi:hypothetical protein